MKWQGLRFENILEIIRWTHFSFNLLNSVKFDLSLETYLISRFESVAMKGVD